MNSVRRAPRARPSVLAVVAAVTLATVPAASAHRYFVRDVGTLGGPTSEAFAINAVGDVTGSADAPFTTSVNSGFVRHAFRLRDGVMTDLMPGATSPEGRPSGIGRAINDSGQVAGSWLSGSADRFAVTWELHHAMAFVATPFGREPAANGINNAGDIVGEDPFGGAWLTTHDGHTTSLGLFPVPDISRGAALDINDRGQVVGDTNVPPDEASRHAFLYSTGVMHDLGTLGGSTSRATAINERGTAVGWSMTVGDAAQHAVMFRNGRIIDLGTLGGGTQSEAQSINDCSETVGSSDGRAFLYRHGVMVDLNSLLPHHSHWTLTTANGINDRHMIVGTGLHNGVQRGFMLIPRRWRPRCRTWHS